MNYIYFSKSGLKRNLTWIIRHWNINFYCVHNKYLVSWKYALLSYDIMIMNVMTRQHWQTLLKISTKLFDYLASRLEDARWNIKHGAITWNNDVCLVCPVKPFVSTEAFIWNMISNRSIHCIWKAQSLYSTQNFGLFSSFQRSFHLNYILLDLMK